ncbi:beta-ketoacyl synthase chain length factor [Solwaraspora sp. WMMD406]|uniref:beta-ketoacyl synthase chain length factor n=1 Tax=Solwaraspora sp. WMMD406 TaxID=3016095 RepID=UPI002416BD09|nr:beta-ketoacyl synthase chain length factor [Solwaraspora sp. WMMD406]MDG4764617.1 beta-ketoacyl synthase chain length factor [Solwaraspora sp. WMMD406]
MSAEHRTAGGCGSATRRLLAEATWPEPGDGPPPALPGFVHSDFNPLVAAVAERCLTRAYGQRPAPDGARVAVVLVSADGDRASAAHVRATVAAGGRPGPLYFFQSVPNSVLGHVAARWNLDGPVLCLAPTGDPRDDGLAEADLLLYDGDADAALLVLIEQIPDDGGADDPDRVRAVAVLVGGGETR